MTVRTENDKPRTTIKLYEATASLAAIEDMLIASEGELTDEIAAALDAAEGAFAEKVERCGLKARELKATADAIKAEADVLRARAANISKAYDSLREYVKRQMEIAGKTSVKGLLCSPRIQANSVPSVTCSILDLSHAPLDYAPFVRRVEHWTLDRDAVIAAWKSEKPLPPEITVEVGTHLRV